ncbi:MAG TPA: DUF4129 domain-containing protein [Gaiellaceae bacterium]|nr:DUF4129 domain-containing protein [Gaiellaceae bacterium]
MLTPGRGHERTQRAAVTAVVLLVLLGLVAYASSSGLGRTRQSQPTPGYVSWAMSIFLVIFVLMIPVAIYIYFFQGRDEILARKAKQQSFGIRVAKRLAVLALILLIFGLRVYLGKNWQHLSFLHHQSPGPTGTRSKLHEKGGNYNPSFQWPVLYVTLVLFALLAGWLWLQHRKELAGRPLLPERTAAEDVAASITDAIDDLEAEPDPRRAVIAAYARMETAFGRNGLTRRPSETAVEYLRRILLGLGSRSEPVTRLTGLFEQAKFSHHRIDRDMKYQAIDALRAIRADLSAA